MHRTVPPYAGMNQQTAIEVPNAISNREVWEESCWVMPPYAVFYPPPPEPPQPTRAMVPPPLFKTDLWSAMQTWPL